MPAADAEVATERAVTSAASILALNAGSSSIKFAIYRLGPPLQRALAGHIDRARQGAAKLSWRTEYDGRRDLPFLDDQRNAVIDWIEARTELCGSGSGGTPSGPRPERDAAAVDARHRYAESWSRDSMRGSGTSDMRATIT